MKEGTTSKGPIIVDGVTVGYCFGSGCWAEHEMGIRGLLDAIGAPTRPGFGLSFKSKAKALREAPSGISRRSSTKVPPRYTLIDTVLTRGKRKTLDVHIRGFGIDTGGWGGVEYLKDYFRDASPRTRTFWDENSLMIVTSDPDMFSLIDRLDAAISGKNLTIWVGGGNVFGGGGLCLIPRDDVPKDVVEAWETADREEIETLTRAAATGIEDRLRAAGLDWFSLQPKMLKGELNFWLNPTRQDRHNSGWYTVSDLDDWIAGKGSVMKGKKSA